MKVTKCARLPFHTVASKRHKEENCLLQRGKSFQPRHSISPLVFTSEQRLTPLAVLMHHKAERRLTSPPAFATLHGWPLSGVKSRGTFLEAAARESSCLSLRGCPSAGLVRWAEDFSISSCASTCREKVAAKGE